MYNQIRMPLACFALLIYTLSYYSVKKRLRTANAKTFESMATFGLLHVLASIVTEYTVNNRLAVSPLFNEVWHIIFLVSCSALCALLYLYLIQYVERGTCVQHKKSKKCLLLVLVISVLGELTMPIEYMDTEYGSYSLGGKAYSLYLIVVYCMVMMVVTIIRYRHYLAVDRCVLLLTSVAVFALVSIVQILFPYILLTGFAATFIVMGIMFNTEDVHMYLSDGNHYYNELACREILGEAVLTGYPFQIAMYVFVGRDGAVKAGMRSLSPQLPERKEHVICGAIADNCMLVIPLRHNGFTALLPSLPTPNCSDGDASFFVETVSIDKGETVDEILSRVRNLKNENEERVLQQDDLTGLLRRAPLVRQVEHIILSGQEFTFLMIDLDNFKQVNDRYGHSTGDAVLQEFAGVLRSELRSSDILCRMGGDEFCVVLLGLTNRAKVMEIVDRLQRRITKLETIDVQSVNFSISVGARVNDKHNGAGSFQQIYAESDAALYQAKYRGKKCLSFSEN